MSETVKLLKRGENVNLTRQFNGLTKYRLGLSWDLVPGKVFDLDLSILCLSDKVENGGKIIDLNHLVFYGSNDPDRPGNDKRIFDLPGGGVGFKDPEGAVMHYGDCRDGAKEGDDETVKFDFSKMDPRCKSVLVVASIYDPENQGFNFGLVKNSMVKLYKEEEDVSILAYELKEDFSGSNCLEFVEFYLHNNEWKISALGDGNSNNFEQELKKFGIPVE